MKSKYWLVQALIGAVFGIVIAVLIEVVVIGILSELFGERLRPRGLFWIVFPLLGAGFGWKFGRYVGAEGLAFIVAKTVQEFDRYTRAWIAASIIWVVSSAFYMLTINPFGYHWYRRDWQAFWLISFVPVIIGGLALKLTRWVIKADTKNNAGG